MPELPEVETIKNDLKKAILGKKIAGVEVRDKKAVKNSLADFLKALAGNSFAGINRIGKLLIFSLKRAAIPPRRDAHTNNNKNEDGKYLLIHLKMTGQLIYITPPPPTPSFVRRGNLRIKERGLNPPMPLASLKLWRSGPLLKGVDIIAGGHSFPEAEDHPTKFTRAIFKFADGATLYFNDMRRFGYLKIADKDELKKIEAEYGVDPLNKDFKYENLRKIFQNRKITVKQALMDQKLMAGIGNIYSDEILFAARVKPTRPVNSLKEAEIKKIFSVIRPILKKAIKHRGTSFSDYVDGQGRRGNFTSFLKIYGRKAGEKCPVCGGPVRAAKIGGRTAKFCPKCQK